MYVKSEDGVGERITIVCDWDVMDWSDDDGVHHDNHDPEVLIDGENHATNSAKRDGWLQCSNACLAE